jgi:hypothetical protein
VLKFPGLAGDLEIGLARPDRATYTDRTATDEFLVGKKGTCGLSARMPRFGTADIGGGSLSLRVMLMPFS